MNNRLLASVILPTYQRRALVQRALEAFAQQTISPDQFEVIVSIDGSDDGTREMVEAFTAPYQLHVIWHPNAGRAAACNAAIRAARGELIVIIDDDMQPVPGFIEAHLRAHREQPDLAVMGAAPIPQTDQTSPVGRYIATKFHEHLARLGGPDHLFTIRDCYTGNFSIRREWLVEVGLFDEAFRIYGNEDVELAARLTRSGARLAYASEAIAFQSYVKDYAGLARDNLSKGKTAVLLAEKHPDVVSQLRLGQEHITPWRRRLIRSGLLSASRAWPTLSELVVRGGQWLEHHRPGWLPGYCEVTLDYFFWLGVRTVGATRSKPV